MSRRRELQRHHRQLMEIRKIMESMKTLAYLETHKLNRRINAQHQLEKNIDAMATDFLSFNPEVLPGIEPAAVVFLLIGSQRGFCGNFNDVLLEQWQLENHHPDPAQTRLVLVGQKLHAHRDDFPFAVSVIEGANVAEEINVVVENIVRVVAAENQPLTALQASYHAAENQKMVSEKLLPPFVHVNTTAQVFQHPPLLNIPPADFFLELTDYYLFSALHRILYDSLMAENQQRLRHLEKAVRHLDHKGTELIHQGNALRQEEIIEEIEVILLNASSF